MPLCEKNACKFYLRAKKFPPTLRRGGIYGGTRYRAPLYLACAFCRRLRQSAIMAMNSELVGLPLQELTV